MDFIKGYEGAGLGTRLGGHGDGDDGAIDRLRVDIVPALGAFPTPPSLSTVIPASAGVDVSVGVQRGQYRLDQLAPPILRERPDLMRSASRCEGGEESERDVIRDPRGRGIAGQQPEREREERGSDASLDFMTMLQRHS